MIDRVSTDGVRRGPRPVFLGLIAAIGGAAALLVPAAPAPAQEAAAGTPAKAPTVVQTAQDTIRKGAAFLIGSQNDNGSWGFIPGAPEQGEIGVTGLVLRAVAKAPTGARPEGTDAAIDKALGYLLAKQQANGSFSPPGTGLATYRTALTITALKAVDGEKYADQIARARDYLVGGQFSEKQGLEKEGATSPYYGGWGYGKDGKSPDADLSNAHFAIEALKQAGISEDSDVWKRAVIFLQRCQNRSESNDVPTETVAILDDGGFMYDPALDQGKSVPTERPDGKVSIPSYASMTYAGLMSLLHANVGKDDPRVQAAFGWIQRHYTLTENQGLGSRKNPAGAQQGLFYYYQAFAKALDAWGEASIQDAAQAERRWANDLTLHLAGVQTAEGFWVNSNPRWWEADPVLCTGYAVLALDIAYPWLLSTSDQARD